MQMDEKLRFKRNAAVLEAELDWFHRVLESRLKLHFNHGDDREDPLDIPPPNLNDEGGYYAALLEHYQCTRAERLVLILCLIPHIRPQILDVFFTKNKLHDRICTEFGGIKDDLLGPFLPTVETALFLLAGHSLTRRFTQGRLFEPDSYLLANGLVHIGSPGPHMPVGQSPIHLSPDLRDMMTTGRVHKPNFGIDFPARLITTDLEWRDLILDHLTQDRVLEIKAWLDHGSTLLEAWGLAPRIKPGYRSLFFGPPGTGKTLTAALLGKYARRDVYRIDLSMVVSKYIGETEKNLEKIFTRAQQKDWLLFFDEADALFGKRTKVHDAHDRFANQEVSYLLQRVEDFPGVVILATNFKTNMDEAFTRRFQSIIHFPMPGRDERLRLWRNGFSPKSSLAPDIDMEHIAAEHELSGGSIMNIIQHCSITALKDHTTCITQKNLDAGIRREFLKEGRGM